MKEIVTLAGWPGFNSGHGVILYFKVLSGGPVDVYKDYPVNNSPVNYTRSELAGIERVFHGSAHVSVTLLMKQMTNVQISIASVDFAVSHEHLM